MTPARPALLVGSVNLPSRDEVFAAVSRHLNGSLRSVPDGETGDRGGWMFWQTDRLRKMPELEILDEMTFANPLVEGEVNTTPFMAPREGAKLADLDFGPLGYLENARQSYAAFKAARSAGEFTPQTRFQVSIPTPMMFAMLFPQHRLEALDVFEGEVGGELDAILAAIPHEDLAIQWDVAGETQIQEQFRLAGDTWDAAERWGLEEATGSIARMSARIPEEVMLGIHLCYGDPDGKHVIEPVDTTTLTQMANGASELIPRRLDWIHMPVPIDRDDDAYFAPLDGLALKPEVQLYLGLLHKEDGIEGAKRRIAAASEHVEGFGVATECGLGREPRDGIDGLLSLYGEATAV